MKYENMSVCAVTLSLLPINEHLFAIVILMQNTLI